MKTLQADDLFLRRKQLLSAKNLQEKLELVRKSPLVQEFSFAYPRLFDKLLQLEENELYLVFSIIISGQKHLVLYGFEQPFWRKWMRIFTELEHFYTKEGGIIGYQCQVKKLLAKTSSFHEVEIETPPYCDISKENTATQEKIIQGMQSLHQLCLLFPVGGAADRLHLVDEITGQELPAGCLFFSGETLLEKLFFDIEGWEYLYYKLYNKTISTPIILMSSKEKKNHHHITAILKKRQYFSRRKSTVQVIMQPSVPVVDKEGLWCLKGPEDLLVKPSGHGALWHLLQEKKLFSWLRNSGRKKALIRQINNPVSRFDYGLLAFLGCGFTKDANFGAVACERKIGAKEGICVLVKKQERSGFVRHLSNIEYCDFARCAMEDTLEPSETPNARYLSNTNILFVDLLAAEKAVDKDPFPGVLLNFKDTIAYTSDGFSSKKAARVESTMQNISDQILETKRDVTEKIFVAYHQRNKSLSTAKKARRYDQDYLETPELCFYDCLKNSKELLDRCHIKHPPLPSFSSYLESSLPFLVHYHPALGPLYDVIAQKVQLGSLKEGSSLRLQIAELFLLNIDIEGDLCVQAENITGERRKQQFCYSEQTGKCVLQNVRIKNQGLKKQKAKDHWKPLQVKESFSIFLEGNGEFFAQDVEFIGNVSYRVPPNRRLVVEQKGSKLVEKMEYLETPSWYWEYGVKEGKKIFLKKKERKKKQQPKIAASR